MAHPALLGHYRAEPTRRLAMGRPRCKRPTVSLLKSPNNRVVREAPTILTSLPTLGRYQNRVLGLASCLLPCKQWFYAWHTCMGIPCWNRPDAATKRFRCVQKAIGQLRGGSSKGRRSMALRKSIPDIRELGFSGPPNVASCRARVSG